MSSYFSSLRNETHSICTGRHSASVLPSPPDSETVEVGIGAPGDFLVPGVQGSLGDLKMCPLRNTIEPGLGVHLCDPSSSGS